MILVDEVNFTKGERDEICRMIDEYPTGFDDHERKRLVRRSKKIKVYAYSGEEKIEPEHGISLHGDYYEKRGSHIFSIFVSDLIPILDSKRSSLKRELLKLI